MCRLYSRFGHISTIWADTPSSNNNLFVITNTSYLFSIKSQNTGVEYSLSSHIIIIYAHFYVGKALRYIVLNTCIIIIIIIIIVIIVVVIIIIIIIIKKNLSKTFPVTVIMQKSEVSTYCCKKNCLFANLWLPIPLSK